MYLLAASDEQGPASIPNKVCGLFWSQVISLANLVQTNKKLMYLRYRSILSPVLSFKSLQVLGVFLTAAYMVVKGRIFMRALKLWRAAFYKLLQSTR